MFIRFSLSLLISLAGYCLLASTPSGGNCCCGGWTQLFFPNLDFEDGPDPPPGGFIVYGTGAIFGGWTVTRATVDHVEATHAGLGNGNPNGASNFVDLHGSPGFGAISYKLTNLKPGASYRIEFWTAQNGGNHSSTGTLKIAGGAWLNESWTVTISGSVLWFKQSYMFMATSDMADMEFSSVGDLVYAGTLIDDIAIFECPGDSEPPMVIDPPLDEQYNCLNDIPPAPKLNITDDCDLNPIVSYSEKTNKKDDCEQTVERTWLVTDHCNHTTHFTQTITISDKEPPTIISAGTDKIVNCLNYKKSVFSTWLNTHAGAVATDNCKKVLWEYSYDKEPIYGCDTSIVVFIATDACGNQSFVYRNFILSDTTRPFIVKPPDFSVLRCSSVAKDSLRKWLVNHGNALATDSCSAIFWKNNFNGDSSALKITVDFIATDYCGNQSTVKGTFEQIDAPDTTMVNIYTCSSKDIKTDTIYYSLPGCDSVVIRRQIGVRTDSVFLNEVTCDPTKKTEYNHFNNQYSCDSIVVKYFQYHPPDTTHLVYSVCGLKDSVITTNTLHGSVCDSIVILTEVPLPVDSIFRKEYTCDSLKTGIKLQFLKNFAGCDSIVVTRTEFSPVRIGLRDSLICGLKKTYTDTVVFVNGTCDSLLITSYYGTTLDTSYFLSTTCDINAEGVFSHKYSNIYGCDSLAISIITYIPPKISAVSQWTCDPKLAGTDTSIFISVTGCDSLVISTNNYYKPDTVTLIHHTCDSLIAGVRYLHLNGVYCDSVVVDSTYFSGQQQTILMRNVCAKDSVRSDTIRLLTTNLCDSLVITRYYYSPLLAKLKSSDVSCFGSSDGSLDIINDDQISDPVISTLDGTQYYNQKNWNNLSPGRHFLYLKDGKGCLTDTLVFNISEPKPLKIDIGPDLMINPGDPVTLTEKGSEIFITYDWHPTSLFACSFCKTSLIKTDQDTTISLMVTDSLGCTASDTLYIRIRQVGDVFIPNVFSPNGDGINDHFFVTGDARILVYHMQIFDRWGNMVFDKAPSEINQPDQGWDGRFKGEYLNPAVFGYVISLGFPDGHKETLFGDVTIAR
ncbi:MAG: gliding motility-associated C-terminal domain-containing protein [Saprospiraceae bacterium]|mgnify:CR=1 FL=1